MSNVSVLCTARRILGDVKSFVFYAVFLAVVVVLVDKKSSNISSVSHHRLILHIE
ncbi:MAG: hypothetical protein ACJAWT_001349 [Glaciecola sp.]|jgi:hypothetical protein